MKFFIILSMMYLVNHDSVVQAKLPNKITGGRPTTLTAHPYHVSVYYNDHVMCTGSIISHRHILTSASCVLLEVDSMLSVIGNVYVLTGSNDPDNTRGLREFYQVDTVTWHNNYMPRRFWRNDIAILQLEKEITFLSTRSRITLPQYLLRYKKIFTLTNWGVDQSSTNNDKRLQYIYVSGQTNLECHEEFPLFYLNYRTQGCAKAIFFENSGTTLGDGGAALVHTNQVIGIVIVQAKLPNKLTGGRPTTLTAYPYHVSVYFNGHVICTGSIISHRHILTSASCVLLEVDRIISAVGNIEVLTGSNDSDNTRGLREFYQVYAVIWHDNYIPSYYWKNDIAVLILERAITFLPTRSRVDISDRPLRYNAILNLVNWGNDPSSINDDKYLQQILVTGKSSFECQKIFPLFTLNYKTQGCAIIDIKNAGITLGDSGAALIYDTKVVGIVTGILPEKPQFVIYTKIYPYVVVQAKLPNKITGGRPTTLTAHPYHVSVYFNSHVMCTGSIISHRHILTSASCVLLEVDGMFTAIGNIEVLTGSNDLSDSRGLRQFHQVYAVIWHDYYMPHRFWRNDIAILHLERAITYLTTRSKVGLPDRALRFNAILNLVNWGNDPSSTNNDKYLQHIYVAGQKNSECQKIFPDFLLDYRTQVVHANIPNKLVGGIRTSLSKHVFHASIQHHKHIICVGSIITKQHILTSASCVVQREKKSTVVAGNLEVLVGSSDTPDEMTNREIHLVKSVIFHKDYTPTQVWKNDIAILSLENFLKFSSNCWSIFLSKNPSYDNVMSLTNWGNDVSRENEDKYFQSIYASERSNGQCHVSFPKFILDFTTQGCADTVFFFISGVTLGDGGTALVYDHSLKGIATAFIPGDRKSFIFTKIIPFQNFIQSVIEKY
ncbi:hypothetical protein HCN44_011360 [Aphidius gifuensis]|uniref:Peptidase S1 domain-containing protein n=1 Tax=Aphidius gifuensis TaxID=684658 RepID=A0A834XWI8_APHGI|nr:hypothetical protein HCN44_011360 [Aphidius gifuensis]